MVMLAHRHEVERPACIPHGNRQVIWNEEDSMILHLTSVENIVNGRVHDPARVKHGIVTGKRISDLSWWIDPATHLNLDLPTHLMEQVFVVSRLEKGARILADGNRFMYVPVERGAYRHLGKVDMAERRRVSLRQASVPDSGSGALVARSGPVNAPARP